MNIPEGAVFGRPPATALPKVHDYAREMSRVGVTNAIRDLSSNVYANNMSLHAALRGSPIARLRSAETEFFLQVCVSPATGIVGGLEQEVFSLGDARGTGTVLVAELSPAVWLRYDTRGGLALSGINRTDYNDGAQTFRSVKWTSTLTVLNNALRDRTHTRESSISLRELARMDEHGYEMVTSYRNFMDAFCAAGSRIGDFH